MKIRVSTGEKVFRVCNYIILSLLVLACFYPFWHALMASFSDADQLRNHIGLLFKPVGF